MGTKTISISDEAYNILKARKGDSESFSKAIVRLSGKKKLMDFFGVLSKETGERLSDEIDEMRKVHRKLHEKRLKNDI